MIPHALQYTTIRWLYSLLGHVGITRLTSTISSHFWFPNMTQAITEFIKKYIHCQRYDKHNQKNGHVPPKRVHHFLNPWDEFEDSWLSGYPFPSRCLMRKCKVAQFVIRATTHSTLKFSPGELAFGRNILHPFSTQVNWEELLKKKQETIEKANIK